MLRCFRGDGAAPFSRGIRPTRAWRKSRERADASRSGRGAPRPATRPDGRIQQRRRDGHDHRRHAHGLYDREPTPTPTCGATSTGPGGLTAGRRSSGWGPASASAPVAAGGRSFMAPAKNACEARPRPTYERRTPHDRGPIQSGGPVEPAEAGTGPPRGGQVGNHLRRAAQGAACKFGGSEPEGDALLSAPHPQEGAVRGTGEGVASDVPGPGDGEGAEATDPENGSAADGGQQMRREWKPGRAYVGLDFAPPRRRRFLGWLRGWIRKRLR